MHINELISQYFIFKRQTDENYTYNDAKIFIIEQIKNKQKLKIESFNKEIIYSYDSNGMPKIIHFTIKNKNNIDNSIWKDCLKEYYKLYPDYKIILYDDNDIFKIIENFDKKNLNLLKNIKKGAILADIFRYLILYLRGGYYSDMDCFPHKRIDTLSNIQYHGDDNNNIYLCNKNYPIINSSSEFYINPCDNCKLIYGNYNVRINSVFKCYGHKYIKDNTSIIVGYEFDKTWHYDIINGKDKNLWTDNKIGICQWFIGSKPNEKLFLKCYKNSIKNLSQINNNIKDKNYHFSVINSTGPLFFTKIINSFLSNDYDFKSKLCILPCDYFCYGSGRTVPSTKNKFIEHKFTGTWLK
jgi:mannosyltransferase OCH1-like enzyme